MNYNEVLHRNIMLKTRYKFVNQKWGGLEIKKVEILTIHYTTRKLYYFGVHHDYQFVPIFFCLSPSSFLPSATLPLSLSHSISLNENIYRSWMFESTHYEKRKREPDFKGVAFFFLGLILHYSISCACKIEWENSFTWN